MLKYVVLDKKVGETPLMALTAWKEVRPEYKNIPASYAGRLDPMASGKLLILLGEECKKQKEYTKLDKEYEIEVLLDVGSDTGDALGLVAYSGKETPVDNFSRLGEILKKEEGRHIRPYPHFSSKTVDGKPLFLHVLEGNLSQITIPTHEERIYRIQVRDVTSLPVEKLKKRITEFLARVPHSDEASKQLGADFRIGAVREGWSNLFTSTGNHTFVVVSLLVVCGSGTYMRALAPRIGTALGTEALALSIHRSWIGRRTWYTDAHTRFSQFHMKYGIALVVIVLALGGGWYFFMLPAGPGAQPSADVTLPIATTTPTETVSDTPSTASTTPATVQEVRVTASNFSFDPKEIRVKEGTKVRIVFTNSAGTHDWVIDEFDARTKILQGGGTETIEFVANKKGTFEYYCSVGSHRQMGMKGNLIVE